ncbi:MAG: phospholipase D family protein [Hyphomicrobiales bacterium]
MPVTPLIQASRAYPAMERMVMGATTSVWLAFRIFDPQTKLRSAEAIAHDLHTWADLARWSCERGVDWRIRLTDFDAIGATDLHGLSHRSVEGFRQAVDANMQAIAALHPHELGWVPRLAFWWPARHRLRQKIADLRVDGSSDQEIAHTYPGLRAWLDADPSNNSAVNRWPPFSLHPLVHHEKLMIIDQDRMILGGLDVNERRYDDAAHKRPSDQTWHDVSLMIEGEAEPTHHAAQHLVTLWNDAIGTQDHGQTLTPLAANASKPERQSETLNFVRTVSLPCPGAATIGPNEHIREIEEAHCQLIQAANDLIYLETQYLRSSVITDALCTRAERNPNLRLIALLPAAPDDLAFENNTGPDSKHGTWLQAKAVDRIKQAFGKRAVFLSLVGAKAPEGDPQDITDHARVNRQPIIYVHSKVMIVDGREALVSSANLNGRSMRWDTESGVVWRDATAVAAFQQALWTKHFKALTAPEFTGENASLIMEAFHRAAAIDQDTFLALYPHQRTKRFSAAKVYVPDNMV